jgi:uncharacterized membrane protein
MKKKPESLFTKERVETFTDGIFAIIITLLIFEIRVPHISDLTSHSELFTSLSGLSSKFISWIIAFFTICVIWVNHHRLFKMFHIITHGLFWWNAFLLLWVSLIPFPTALMGDYPDNNLAVSFYGICMSLMAISFSLMRMYVIKNNTILNSDTDLLLFKKDTKLSVIFGPVLYLAGAALAWVHPYISFLIYFAIPVYFIFPNATKD